MLLLLLSSKTSAMFLFKLSNSFNIIEVRLDCPELLKNSFEALWKTFIVCFIEVFISALQVLIWSMFSSWFIFSSSDED